MRGATSSEFLNPPALSGCQQRSLCLIGDDDLHGAVGREHPARSESVRIHLIIKMISVDRPCAYNTPNPQTLEPTPLNATSSDFVRETGSCTPLARQAGVFLTVGVCACWQSPTMIFMELWVENIPDKDPPPLKIESSVGLVISDSSHKPATFRSIPGWGRPLLRRVARLATTPSSSRSHPLV